MCLASLAGSPWWVEANGYKFEVLDSTGFRVLRVRVIPLKKDDQEKEAAVHEQ